MLLIIIKICLSLFKLFIWKYLFLSHYGAMKRQPSKISIFISPLLQYVFNFVHNAWIIFIVIYFIYSFWFLKYILKKRRNENRNLWWLSFHRTIMWQKQVFSNKKFKEWETYLNYYQQHILRVLLRRGYRNKYLKSQSY